MKKKSRFILFLSSEMNVVQHAHHFRGRFAWQNNLRFLKVRFYFKRAPVVFDAPNGVGSFRKIHIIYHPPPSPPSM